MTHEEIKAVIRLNSRRRWALFAHYDPVTGEGSPIDRANVRIRALDQDVTWGIPVEMHDAFRPLWELVEQMSVEDILIKYEMPNSEEAVSVFVKELIMERFRWDFEFWAIMTVKIMDKELKKLVPFRLRQAQRKVLKEVEKQRIANVPIRIIIDKARQWGGSTFVQVYMAWIQLMHKTSWHSTIVADVEKQVRNIRAMYRRLIMYYPADYASFTMIPYEGSAIDRYIPERDSAIIVGSAQKPDNIRSFDIAMVHLSEVALFKTTQQRSAEDLAQSIRASVLQAPYSFIALESTPKGVGNFFHREWLLAMEGKSGYAPIFVAWYEIEIYQKDILNKDMPAFIKWVMADSYARELWEMGATLEGINWYFDFKRRENYDDWRMKSEFPSNWQESFVQTGARVFAPDYVLALRKDNREPEFIGTIKARAEKGKEALQDIELIDSTKGELQIWAMPDKTTNISDRYVAAMDIGGRTHDADWTVIRVIDRYWMIDGGKPEVVATWRGHIDQDLAAWIGIQIAKLYNDALFIPESNTYDKGRETAEGDHFLTILDEVVEYYPNIYVRTDPEKIRQGAPVKYGFHTNVSTKPMIINHLNGILREGMYVEPYAMACDEMDTFEIKPNGTYGAVEGCHDDIVMPTAIGLWAAFKYMPPPKEIAQRKPPKRKGRITEATI
jgi:hypothetical protein